MQVMKTRADEETKAKINVPRRKSHRRATNNRVLDGLTYFATFFIADMALAWDKHGGVWACLCG
ncbi:hypothetical protein F4680DRAFT_445122 [Xylaria scruposa]|nr:hypothetical protein F4680DRAFT_445122 [Xylaria scruposa]